MTRRKPCGCTGKHEERRKAHRLLRDREGLFAPSQGPPGQDRGIRARAIGVKRSRKSTE